MQLLGKSPSAIALRITVAYGLLAGLWVLLADDLLEWLGIGQTSIQVHVAVDIVLAGSTSFVFFFLLRRELLRRQAAEASERSGEQRLLSVLKTAADAVIVVDDAYRVQLFNQGAERIFGYESGEILGAPVDLLLPEASVERHRQYMREFAAQAGPARLMGQRREVAGRRKDGSVFPAEASISRSLQGERLAFTVILHDITRRKQVEAEREAALAALNAAHDRLRHVAEDLDLRVRERTGELETANRELAGQRAALADEVKERERAQGELRYQHDKLMRILDTMRDGVYIVDRDCAIEYVNPALVREFGMVAGRKCFAYFHGRDSVCPWCKNELVWAGQTVRWEFQPGLSQKTYDLIDAPLLNPDGTISKLELLRDVTEQRHAQQERERQAAELAVLLDISHNVASTLDLGRLLALILDQLKTLIDYTGAAIFVPREDSIVILEYQGPLSRQDVLGFHAPLSESPGYREVLRSRQPVIIPDLQGDSLLAQNYRVEAARQIKQSLGSSRSWMGVPLMVKDNVIGLLRLDRTEPNYFTRQHALLAKAVADQAALAMENARLYAGAQQTAALEERQRLARDLHDSVSQALYGIVLGAHAARKMLAQSPDQVEPTLSYVLTQAEIAATEMRALIFELRPESLAREGVIAAVARQVAATRARLGIEVNAELGAEPSISLEAKADLYRIAQEALQNTVRHAKATRVDLHLFSTSDYVILQVTDNGAGFDPLDAFPGHLGLQSMRERAVRHGGILQVDSQPGCGTRVSLRLPLLR